MNTNNNDPEEKNPDDPLNSAFLLPNGFNHQFHQIPAIELISVQSVTYTSLKDLIPSSPPGGAIMSPTHNSSWHDEIPIKNPLVKHAALAYLQPVGGSLPEVGGDKGLFGKLKDLCCCQCGCFVWVNDVVFRSVREVFGGDNRREDIVGIDEDDDEEDDEYDDEKVD